MLKPGKAGIGGVSLTLKWTKLVSQVGNRKQGDKAPGSNHFLLPGFWFLAKNTWELQTLALPRASRLELWTLQGLGVQRLKLICESS